MNLIREIAVFGMIGTVLAGVYMILFLITRIFSKQFLPHKFSRLHHGHAVLFYGLSILNTFLIFYSDNSVTINIFIILMGYVVVSQSIFYVYSKFILDEDKIISDIFIMPITCILFGIGLFFFMISNGAYISV